MSGMLIDGMIVTQPPNRQTSRPGMSGVTMPNSARSSSWLIGIGRPKPQVSSVSLALSTSSRKSK